MLTVLGDPEVWRYRGDELGAGVHEEFFECLGALIATLHLCEVFRMLIPQDSLDALIQFGRAERNTQGQQCVHLVALFVDLRRENQFKERDIPHGDLDTNHFKLVRPGVVLLRPRNKQKNVRKRLDGVRVSPHHHFRKQSKHRRPALLVHHSQ